MKTTAFLIRVAICFFLSLIPATDLENRVYSARMELRGHWDHAPNLLILNVDPQRFRDDQALRSIMADMLHQGVRQVLAIEVENSNHLITDTDGVVRSAVLKPHGQPSLTYEALLQVVDGSVPGSPRTGRDLRALRNPSEPHLINYAGPAGSIPWCRLGQHDCPELRDLKGRIVLLNEDQPTGASPALLRTPLGEMGKPEVIANDLNTVLNHKPIYQASFIERMLLILSMILVGAFYIIYYPVLISALAVTGTGVAVVIVLFQLIFQFFDIYIPSVNIGLSLLITYLTFTGYRLAFQENLQWRSLKQSQYLKELDQMKTNFLSLVSHDLKTPIAKIQAVSERLRRELSLPAEDRSDWRELIESIENSNNELKHYITSILNLSKIESQKVILNKKSNDINQLILQALKRLRSVAQQKGISVQESLEPLFSVECDEDLIRQVLTNLIDNAIKYSPTGSKVLVRSREEEGFIRVEVEDFGPGIPKDQLPLMFRKFSRFLRPMKEQVKGTGLGLYLSKFFIELHGGTIRVHSVEGQGTTFTFTLPLHGVESETLLS